MIDPQLECKNATPACKTKCVKITHTEHNGEKEKCRGGWAGGKARTYSEESDGFEDRSVLLREQRVLGVPRVARWRRGRRWAG